MNQGWTYTDYVKATGETVLGYYLRRYQHSSASEWQSRIDQELILLDGCKAEAQTVLSQGQTLTYRRLPWREPAVPMHFEVLYEDADLWAVAKPAGLPILPGGKFLQHTLLHIMRSRYPNEQPAPVHRLGRGTSGVMLVAKSTQARSDLARQFRAKSQPNDRLATGSMQKIYRALIGPTTKTELPERFVCDYPIGKIPYPQLGYVYGRVAAGMHAHSKGQVLARRSDSTLVEMSIYTGRSHQIRIHLAAAGHPLLGDPLYAAGGIPISTGQAVPSDCGYRLHAHRLQFEHPQTKEWLSVVAPPPADLSIQTPQGCS